MLIRGGGPRLSAQCVKAMERFKDFLLNSQPTRIQSIQRSSKRTWMIFTDACYEPTSSNWRCGIGGVIVSPDGSPYQAFSFKLEDWMIDRLGGSKKDTIIFEAELLAVLIACAYGRPHTMLSNNFLH